MNFFLSSLLDLAFSPPPLVSVKAGGVGSRGVVGLGGTLLKICGDLVGFVSIAAGTGTAGTGFRFGVDVNKKFWFPRLEFRDFSDL